MVVAIGTDIVDISRIQHSLDNPRTGDRFAKRVFTPEEIEYCTKMRRSQESFAARFAAKEAVMKALGKGFGEGIGWREIEVVRETGRPVVVLHGNAREQAEALGITRWHLSLSHTNTHAIAYVVAEGA